MLDIYKEIYKLLEDKENFCLATILEKSGSAPREEGAKMIIKKDYSIIGTIGGGLVESLAIKMSKHIAENKCSVVKSFNLSNKDAESLGLVCGGKIKLLIEYVDSNNEDTVKLYKNINVLKEKNMNFALISAIGEEDKELLSHEKWICTENSYFGNESDEIHNVFEHVRKDLKRIKIEGYVEKENRYLIETIINNEAVYILGAGHVAQKVAEITKTVDFKTVVIDDRAEFANRERFKDADEIKVIPSFNNVFEEMKISEESYIVIVTRGHAFDRQVLAQALRTNAKYIGMIGSKSKTKYVYEVLEKEGFTKSDFERVHAPIGLSINAETPEEIAISIVAELIKVRRGQ